MSKSQTIPTTEREHYLEAFEREYQITLRVLRAFPEAKATLKFTERSTPANQVAWILVISQMVTEPILMVPKLEPQPLPPPPEKWNALVESFERAHTEATKRFAKLSEDIFQSPIVMPSGPGGATVTVRRADALWMMLFDTVHHRGQLSVYLRASGAKVPSIYGASGDEPWA
jgi:uncharacterized damage-inducible protein DinB